MVQRRLPGKCDHTCTDASLFVDVFIYLFLHSSTFLGPLFMLSNNQNRAVHQMAENKTVSV